MDNVDTDIEETYLLWRMCRDRGYSVPEDDLNMSLDDFKSIFGEKPSAGHPSRNDLNMSFNKPGNEESIKLFFPDDLKVGVSTIRTLVDQLVQSNTTSAVIIVRSGMTPSAKKALSVNALAGVFIQSFEQAELIVNITEHELVPKHDVLTEDLKKELLQRYKLQEHQLPRIKLVDPVVRYLGLRRGQVVKITRPSPTAGRYITYRLVH